MNHVKGEPQAAPSKTNEAPSPRQTQPASPETDPKSTRTVEANDPIEHYNLPFTD
jgi:hypothetical protein